MAWTDTENTSAIEVRTIRVHDAFTSGGAQVSGGQHARTVVFGSDLDYVRGNHTIRTGVQVDASRWRSDDWSNYLGTYTFESLLAYEAARPRSYTQRIGDPNVKYENYQGAFYLQDDIRVRRNLTLSGGIRYEAQTHAKDYDNVMPRLGITWAPFTGGQTTLRASWGIFHDWFSMNTYEQTLRVDGVQQQEIDIVNPPYPDFNELVLLAAPGNRYLMGEGVALPRSTRVSLGLDQRYRTLQAGFTYSYVRGGALARGNNLNAPVDGARPDPQFGNIIEVVSDASSRQHQLQSNITVNPGALFPLRQERAAVQPEARDVVLQPHARIDPEQHRRCVRDRAARRSESGVGSGQQRRPASAEHQPEQPDHQELHRRHQHQQQQRRAVHAAHRARRQRRPGVQRSPGRCRRNSERAESHFTLNLNLGYGWTFGPPVGGPPGIGVFVTGGQATCRRSINRRGIASGSSSTRRTSPIAPTTPATAGR